jgi:hypothetical protein
MAKTPLTSVALLPEFDGLQHVFPAPELGPLMRDIVRRDWGEHYEQFYKLYQPVAEFHSHTMPLMRPPGLVAMGNRMNLIARGEYVRDRCKFNIEFMLAVDPHTIGLTETDKWLIRPHHCYRTFIPDGMVAPRISNDTSYYPALHDWCDTIAMHAELAMHWSLYVIALAARVRTQYYAQVYRPGKLDECIQRVLTMILPEWGLPNRTDTSLIGRKWWERVSNPITNKNIADFLVQLRMVELIPNKRFIYLSCTMEKET